MKKLIVALAVGAGLSASALAVATDPDTTGVANAVTGETPPDKPEDDKKPGGDNPPDKPGDGGGSGGSSGEDSVVLTGAYQYTGETNTLADATLVSTTSDQNVILAQTNAYLTVSNCVLNKSGDTTSEDNSNFFALNAVVAAKTAATVCLAHSTLNSHAEGANCLFASGSGSTIYAYDCTITSTNDSSRGLDATYGGTVIASKLTVSTAGDHCASLATDRGNGNISVTDSRLSTAGQGSALIYSTGVIEANGVTGTATGAQIAGIEGLSTIRIRNANLTGSGTKASEAVPNGVIIYQSNSGDSTEGTATFEVSDSTLTSQISDGALFYVTHSAAFITVRNTALSFDTANNRLLNAAGNDGEHGWGTVGSNGAEVVFTAIDQTLAGNIAVDGISSVDLYLTNSTYTGTFEQDSTNAGDGDINVFVSADSIWTVTSNCTLKTLTAADGAQIRDGDGNAVPVVNASGTELRPGTSELKITASAYTPGDFTATNITDFVLSRTAFDAKYGASQSQGGKTYYIKPHAPENAVLKVKIKGEDEPLTPDMDHKYWLDDYWDGENGVTVVLIYEADNGYFFVDGSHRITWELTVTTNKLDINPPASTATVRAQAQCGSSYYLTLKAAIEAAKSRARISLNDNVTLEETLVVTNSITLDLSTNVVTLGSALTNAFHFTAGATVSNGTINSSLAANAAGSTLLRFTDCKATLANLTVNGRGYEFVVLHDSETSSADKYASKKVDASMTCSALTLTGNGCLLSVDYANATLTNGCSITADGTFASFGGAREAAVSCSGNGTVTIADGTYASPKVLQSGDLGGKIVVNGGTFGGKVYSWMAVDAHPELEEYKNYKARFELNAGDYAKAALAFADANARDLDSFTKGEAVEIEVPAGYAWVDNVLVGQPIAAGVASEAYADAQTATNAAEKINADKTSSIAVPTGVEGDAKATYLSKVEATVTGGNCVVIDLTPAAEIEEQTVLDEAVTNATVVEALVSVSATATATIPKTTPGLYYWIEGGTDVGAVTAPGPAALSTTGGSVELSKPALDAAKGKAFFRISAGVSAPVSSNGD